MSTVVVWSVISKFLYSKINWTSYSIRILWRSSRRELHL